MRPAVAGLFFAGAQALKASLSKARSTCKKTAALAAAFCIVTLVKERSFPKEKISPLRISALKALLSKAQSTCKKTAALAAAFCIMTPGTNRNQRT